MTSQVWNSVTVRTALPVALLLACAVPPLRAQPPSDADAAQAQRRQMSQVFTPQKEPR